MRRIIRELLIEDINYAEDLLLKVVDGEYISVEINELMFSSCKEVDEFANLIKEMLKGV